MTIRVAILGAGIFASEEHLPAIEANPGLELKAIYSRSESSATKLSKAAKTPVDVYYDTPASDSKTLDALLARSDVDAVVICIPITSQPPVIKKALAAGKHVLSEKPIAKDIATAKELIAYHKSLSDAPVWAVGENLRFVDAIVCGADKVKEIGGDLVGFHFEMFTLMSDDDKFFNTEWRKVPDYQGGFLLDGGVHFIAALRLMLNAAGQDINYLSARTSLLQQKLAPVDTVNAVLATTGGISGVFRLSFGTEFKGGFEVQVVTTKGRVSVSPVQVTTVTGGAGVETKDDFAFSAGVKSEMETFVTSVQAKKVEDKLSPWQALRDLEILEGMLKSSDTASVVKL